MNNLQLFLVEYRKTCAKLMVEVVDYMIEQEYSGVPDVLKFFDEASKVRDSHPRFSPQYMYHWSYMTYIQDIHDCFKRSTYYSNEGATP